MRVKLSRHRMAQAGLILLFLFALSALGAPLLAPENPAAQRLGEGLQGPSAAHPFGQDRLGRDILSRVLYGGRVSLLVGLVTVGVSLTVGATVGSISGYFGGWIDELLMRLVDIFLAFPGILLAIALTAVLGPSLRNVVIALSAMGWVGYARITRAQILTLRELEFVQAARALGAHPLRILFRHLLPNALSPLIIEATFGMAGAILSEAGLSFLGLGVQPPTPSWGSMMSEGRSYLLIAPHLTLFPGGVLALVVLALNFLGDGLRDLLDVREE
jgi:peptide/nickel transport system permease protein